MKQILLLILLAGCGGMEHELDEELEETTSAAEEAVGCKGKAYPYCLECIGIHCSLVQCGPTEHHFWPNQMNDDRARCKMLVSNWAGPKVCDGLPIVAYKYWFRTTSGQQGMSDYLSCQ
jgi:hypothetical protein